MERGKDKWNIIVGGEDILTLYAYWNNAGFGGSGLTSRHGWDLPFREHFGRDARLRPDPDAQAHSARGRSKKVVTIPIE